MPFFNGIKKKLYFSFESHFRRVPFFNTIKKKLYFSFESLWRIFGSPNDVPLPFIAFLLDWWRPLSLLRSVLAKLELARHPSRWNTPYNMDFPLQPATQCLLKFVAIRCQFCICFGREGSSTKSLTTWTFEGPPFRTDNYTQHFHLNHKTRWEEYQGLAHQEKLKYFNVVIKHAETICHYIKPWSEAITLTVSSNIVAVVIGNMFWHPTNMEGQTRENALSLFKRKEDDNYLVEITKSKQFLLATRYVGRGMLFAMATDVIHDAKEVCDIPKLGACNDYLVASYAKVACALLIEHISQVLCSKWAFSVAFEASTDLQQTSWVDVRIRYYQHSALENLHLITLPFAGRHTGLATFEMFEKLFDAICPLWKDKLIGCSMDGVTNMIKRLSGVVTQIQNVVKPNFMRVWCLLHQIDIIMQKVYKRVGCNFYKTLTSIISFLRHHKNLVEEMQAICPNLLATRWAFMLRVARFLVEKR